MPKPNPEIQRVLPGFVQFFLDQCETVIGRITLTLNIKVGSCVKSSWSLWLVNGKWRLKCLNDLTQQRNLFGNVFEVQLQRLENAFQISNNWNRWFDPYQISNCAFSLSRFLYSRWIDHYHWNVLSSARYFMTFDFVVHGRVSLVVKLILFLTKMFEK